MLCLQKPIHTLFKTMKSRERFLFPAVGRINNGRLEVKLCGRIRMERFQMIQLQDSLFGLRVRQAAAAVRMLEGWEEAQKSSLRFYGEGEFARYASLASLLTGVPAFSDGNYQPYEEIVRERYHDQTHTYEWIFPSALRLLGPEEIRNHPKLQARDPSGEAPDGSR